MLSSATARLLSGFAVSACGSITSRSAATFGTALLRGSPPRTDALPFLTARGAGHSTTALRGFSAQVPSSANPAGIPAAAAQSHDNPIPEASGSPSRSSSTQDSPLSSDPSSAAGPSPGSTSSSEPSPAGAIPVAAELSPSSAAPSSPAPASRRDKSAAAKVVYPSSRDDNLGVQRNWFNALFTQLQVMPRTGLAPHLQGRQKEVFEAVEREFEGLWERHMRGRGLEGTAHRGMLMCCLAVATHKVLLYETGDDALVREVIRTNLGGTAVRLMMRLHKIRLWLLLRLLAEDPYKQAVRFLPSLQGDLGSLVSGWVAEGPGEATWTATHCGFHSVLAAEGATELLPEFCCQFSMQWLEVFAQYGVRVGLEESQGFGDERCMVRISRPGGGRSGGGGGGGDGGGLNPP